MAGTLHPDNPRGVPYVFQLLYQQNFGVAFCVFDICDDLPSVGDGCVHEFSSHCSSVIFLGQSKVRPRLGSKGFTVCWSQ